MDSVTGNWDEDLVRQTFHPDDIQTILAVPVNEDAEDYVGWHSDPKGRFSIKSAYKVQIDNDMERQGTSQWRSQHIVVGFR
jgi:hypothetical protein